MLIIRSALGLALVSLTLGAAGAAAEDLDADRLETEQRLLEHQLDTTQSRVLRDSERPIERSQLGRDLDASEQRLRSLKTWRPNAEATPLLERQLDRLERPARVRTPPPPDLLSRD